MTPEAILTSLESAIKIINLAHCDAELSAIKARLWSARKYLDVQATVIAGKLFADKEAA